MSVIPRVLYVDDDLENLEMMTYWIREECGYDISVAVDGKEAFQLIDTEYFDLFLLDYCLPDMTAVNICERIRSRYPEAPIAVYSALDREVDKQKAFEAGANSFLIKPEQLDQIKPFLHKYLPMRPAKAEATGQVGSSAPQSETGHRSRVKPVGIV
jgi:CheY-like chemotaxis protein